MKIKITISSEKCEKNILYKFMGKICVKLLLDKKYKSWYNIKDFFWGFVNFGFAVPREMTYNVNN